MLRLDRQGDVFVLHMQHGENRFSTPFFDELSRALDTVEQTSGPLALVTVGEGKFYSNGIDLDWLGQGAGDLPGFIRAMHHMLARMLAFPVPTIAALNGHAFAGGALLALAHDFRVMREDRGYFCLPEVDISIPFTVPLAALVRHRLAPQVAHRAMVTGQRFTAAEALGSAVVDAIAPEASVLPKAIELAQSLAAKDRGTLRAIKRNSAEAVVQLLEG